MAEPNAYEEKRMRQVEQNKRKLDELRVHHLSAAVRQAHAKPKPQRKAPAPRPSGPPRRSGRVASLPERRNEGLCATKEERSYAITKALEIEDKLGSDHPIFLKSLIKPTAGWGTLCLPKGFCKKHLPDCKKTIVLVDEVDDEFGMFYRRNSHTVSLCDGWSEFANNHKLADGDCLVFQLIERTKFKVYISRASSYYENDQR